MTTTTQRDEPVATNTPWYVQETTCYPHAFKVTSDYYRPDNSTSSFFETEAEAKAEAERRNVAHCAHHGLQSDNSSPLIDWYKEMRSCVGEAAELADRITCTDSDVGQCLARLCNVVTHLLDENKTLAERVAIIDSRHACEDTYILEASERGA
jgi:hypothetical protein